MKVLKQLLAVALVAGLLLTAAHFLRQALEARKTATATQGAPRSGKVVVHEVAEDDFTEKVEVLGTVRSYESIDVSARVTEIVERVEFADGQMVEKGQPLVKLSSAEDEARMAGAKTQLAEHERELERLRKLAADGAVSSVLVEERETLAELSRRQVQEVQARLADRLVTAPFRGVLGLRTVSAGALISPGTVIATLDQIDQVRLDFPVPEVFLAELETGMLLQARSAAYPARVFEGRVVQISSRVDPTTRSVVVRADIDNPDHALRPGMLLTATVSRMPRSAPALPERALAPVYRQVYVFVVREKDGQFHVERRAVETGLRKTGFVEVTAGLKAGEVVVTDGYMGLGDGSPVEVVGRFQEAAPAFNPRAN
jgi:membrane fusion protein, multidrug efflux system